MWQGKRSRTAPWIYAALDDDYSAVYNVKDPKVSGRFWKMVADKTQQSKNMKSNTKIKIKKILKWFLILLFPLLFILWFFAWTLAPVYIWLSFFIYGSYYLSTSDIDSILSRQPKNHSELHILINQYSENNSNWTPVDDYINSLNEITKVNFLDVDFNKVKWFNKKYNKSDVKYVDTCTVRSRWAQAKGSINGSRAGEETFYFLFDSELNLLGYYHKK